MAKPNTEEINASAWVQVAKDYSVIPVYGDADSERPKVAAIAWTEYQHRQPTPSELRSWFVERQYHGLAIVTGTVSNLIILDFDTLPAFNRFCQQLPQLIDTYTVKSRRGHHLYFRLRPGLSVPSRKGPGVDLLSDGKYAVAPPTCINGWVYKALRQAEVYTLTEDDAKGILAFFGSATTPELPSVPEFAASMPVYTPAEKKSKSSPARLLTDYDLVSRYRYRADSEGRNEALFHISLMARDYGWAVEDALNYLVDVHAKQPAGKSHQHETNAQRRREAMATIQSAFSRSARPCRQRDHDNNAQLPNSVRETLLQIGLTCVVRVLEGLRLTGIEPGQPVIINEALQKLEGRVGRDSIYRAFNAVTPDGQRLFDHLPPRTPNPATADIEQHETHYKKCFVVTPQKPGKIQRGRPAQVFIMPGNLDLCRKLSIKASISDPLTLEDLQGAKQTRQAVHRELIKRRPGQYPCRWLARRLGVCPRTLQAYNREIPIQVRPMYLEMPVTWSTLHRIPDDFEVTGTFLEDAVGKRYPARRDIAIRLLRKGHFVIHKRRDVNYYSYGDTPPNMAFTPGLHPKATVLGGKQAQIDTWVGQHENGVQPRLGARLHTPVLSIAVNCGNLPEKTSLEALPLSDASTTLSVEHTRQFTKPKSKRYYRKPLPDERMERLAQQVHLETTADMANERMSLSNARRLLDTYGAQPVETALKRMVWLRERGKISKPAGFMMVASRIAWRVENGATGLGMPAPRFKGEPGRKRRSTA